MLHDTAETCAVFRARSVPGAGGWEFISGAASLLIKRQVLLLLGLRAGVAVEELRGCVLSGGRGWGW